MKRMTINSDNLSEQVYEFNAEFLGKINRVRVEGGVK